MAVETTNFSENQILNRVFDNAAGAFRVTGSGLSSGGGSGGTGDASAANQTTQITAANLTNIKLDTLLSQTDGLETPLGSIDTKTPALGQALSAASTPVVLPATQISTLTPPAAITGYATASGQAQQIVNLTSIDNKIPALGQALAGSSIPVVLTSAQLSTLTPPSAITGYATASGQANELIFLANIDAGIPATLGQTTKTNSMPVVLPSDYQTPVLPTNAAPTFIAIGANNIDGVASMDASNYRLLTLQLSGTWSATVQVQFSIEGTVWTAQTGYAISGAPSTNLTAAGLYVFAIPPGVLLRIRTTTYVSGSVIGNVALSSLPAAPHPFSVIANTSGVTATLRGPPADGIGTGTPTGLDVIAYLELFNGTTYDKQRANNAVVALASAARTSTTNADVVTFNARTFRVILNITAAPNTASTLTLAIRAKDSISGNYVTLLTGAVETGSVDTGAVPVTKTYSVGAGLVATANVSSAEALARTMNVIVTHSNADSWTYSVSVELGI